VNVGRRSTGSLRVLPSGRVQVRYTGPDGLRRVAPLTFPTKTLARRWLALTEADIVRGVWRDPRAGTETLGDYAMRWVAERGVADRTRELYQGLLERQVLPTLGALDLLSITPGLVRTWRQGLIDSGVGASTVAKAYRLLRAVLNTATDDDLIGRNPCRIKGAGVEPTPERPLVGLAGVMALAEAMPARYRALVLLAVFASMRWGELMGLRRSDLDLEQAVVRIERAVVEVGTSLITKTPKTAAGRRSVALPTWLVPELRHHLALYAELGEDGRVFVGPYGATPVRRNFAVIWKGAKERAGSCVPADLHFHDLRHAGNHFAAASGATTRELMGRMGHTSVRAALIYQHRTVERDRMIADALDALIRARTGDD
jgi:integrase